MKQRLEREEKSEKVVHALIREAFPSIDSRNDMKRLSNDECIDMTLRIRRLNDEDVPYRIAEVLENLLLTHGTNSMECDIFIDYLDVIGFWSSTKSIKQEYGENPAELLIDQLKQFTEEPEERLMPLISLIRGEKFNYKGTDWNDISKDEEERRQNERIYLFNKFSSMQAHAICKWLELAQTWPESLPYRRDIIDSALAYWRARCVRRES